MSKLTVLEYPGSYSARTRHNAQSAQLTVAFAVDFTTAGERLTRSAAGTSYLGFNLNVDIPLIAARRLYSIVRGRNFRTINIAGNGIYTLAKFGWSQLRVNQYLLEVLNNVHRHWPLFKVVSGGQTGADIAGLAAAYAIDVPEVTAVLPKGFKQRLVDGRDVFQTEQSIISQIKSSVFD